MSAEVEKRLRDDVETLASLGPRSLEQKPALIAASEQIKKWVADLDHEEFVEGYEVNGMICENILAHPPVFSPDSPFYLIGAHYDSVPTTSGAHDNLSAVGGCLRSLSKKC